MTLLVDCFNANFCNNFNERTSHYRIYVPGRIVIRQYRAVLRKTLCIYLSLAPVTMTFTTSTYEVYDILNNNVEIIWFCSHNFIAEKISIFF